eukprot:Gb_04110 [translate_table: standard]
MLEGKLTLVDALVYACKQSVDKVVDLATLTIACVIALGNDIVGMFTPNNEMVEEISITLEITRDKFGWFPLEESYWEIMKSGIVDTMNIGGRLDNSITATLLLK